MAFDPNSTLGKLNAAADEALKRKAERVASGNPPRDDLTEAQRQELRRQQKEPSKTGRDGR